MPENIDIVIVVVTDIAVEFVIVINIVIAIDIVIVSKKGKQHHLPWECLW